ncbi:allophanate hydrolase [mine drainage metagenome]|uniref:Allophanate hydrolase n=1 Tax=mine drainage metagenome TaxID=410659 RepID=A0A1J5SE27_9ZZZZ
MPSIPDSSLGFSALRKTQETRSVESCAADWCDRLDARGDDAVWISRLTREALLARARSVDAAPASGLPLRGLPFAIKDNIDFAPLPTTAACPDFAYTPARSARVVQRLEAAGAVALGKTNLDQFATGLVGVRSPYGVPRNPFGAEYIPGGSSSGSAVAVAAGLCSFALGTDTAGSGRVPAAFNHLVGLKPTRGLISTLGVVPACRSLDCVSIFTRRVGEAAEVLRVAAGYEPEDPWSRRATPPSGPTPWPPRIGVPRADQLEFFGDAGAAGLFASAVSAWRALGASVVEIDYGPFLATARLLYEGPWVAERYAAIGAFLERSPGALHPVTREIIAPAASLRAVSAFEAQYRLAELRREADAIWESVDAILTPTTPTIYSVAEVEADPIRLNSRLGLYTNHMNLLDLCAIALPAGFLQNGMPWGVTLSAPAFHDDRLLAWAARSLGEEPPASALYPASHDKLVRVAVCGAHLSGLPLNGQLLERGGRLVRAARTAPAYRFYALPGTTPPKPGLVRVTEEGRGIEVEVWEIPVSTYGSFVAGIPAPLGIGTLELEDGERVQGFLCEAAAVGNARDLTELGGWRAYLSINK